MVLAHTPNTKVLDVQTIPNHLKKNMHIHFNKMFAGKSEISYAVLAINSHADASSTSKRKPKLSFCTT